MASRDPGFHCLKAPQFLGPRDTGPEGRMVSGAQGTETTDGPYWIKIHDSRRHRKILAPIDRVQAMKRPTQSAQHFENLGSPKRNGFCSQFCQMWLSVVLGGQLDGVSRFQNDSKTFSRIVPSVRSIHLDKR